MALYIGVAVSEQRGVILNPARMQQIVSFEGMKYGTITPTDIDGFIEYKNKWQAPNIDLYPLIEVCPFPTLKNVLNLNC